MLLHDLEFAISTIPNHEGLLAHIANVMRFRFSNDVFPVRFAITKTTSDQYHCEVGVVSDFDTARCATPDSIFRFSPRKIENNNHFTAVLLVPTGIGCEIGGHSGDATPVARLIGAACDELITHPNVVNASDLNEMPPNTLYVEGSVISRLLMGTIGLSRVRTNRILVIIDDHEDPDLEDPHPIFRNNAINAVNGARASAGFNCDHVATLAPRMVMETSYTTSGRAAGCVKGFDRLCELMDEYKGKYDSVAITTIIDVDRDLHDHYFNNCGDTVNPWGGVEALLTHTLSSLYNLPSAHSPMYENREIMNEDAGVMEPRVAAEGVSVAFLHCILRGLDRSPRIITDAEAITRPGVVNVEDVSCLIIPDGCLGLPTLAALEQGIPVIAVRENKNKMQNDLSALPWVPGQLHIVENYWEAVGVMTAIRAGIAPSSARRPFAGASVDEAMLDGAAAEAKQRKSL